MAERYERVYTLKSNLYQTGAPLIIVAGALLKDNQDNTILAQLKIKSIANKPVKAIRVALQPYDVSGKPLGSQIEHQYHDLSVNRDDEFGQKVPIRLPDNTARQFTVNILNTVFKDGSRWIAESFEMEIFKKPVLLKDALNNDVELIKQFQLEYGTHSKYMPSIHKSYWICSCGAVNRNDETKCHMCSNEKSILLNIDYEQLEAHKDIRLKENIYKKAIELAKKNTLDSLSDAISIMESLIGWKDCDELCEIYRNSLNELKNLQYEKAVELSRQNSMDSLVDAKELMEQLKGWKDSSELARQYLMRINSAKYEKAFTLAKQDTVDSLMQAKDIMRQLNGWSDSLEKADEYEKRIQKLEQPPIPTKETDHTKQDNVKKTNPKLIGIIIAAIVGLILLAVGLSGGLKNEPTEMKYEVAGMVDFKFGGPEYYSAKQMDYMGAFIDGYMTIYPDDTVTLYVRMITEDADTPFRLDKAAMILDETGDANAITLDENTKTYVIKKAGEQFGSITIQGGEICFYFTDNQRAFVFVKEGIDPTGLSFNSK